MDSGIWRVRPTLPTPEDPFIVINLQLAINRGFFYYTSFES